jgi:hypothetical protein
MEVETPKTLRARELAAAYQALVATANGDLENRLSALFTVRQLAKQVNCSLTRELLGLVDREQGLLHRCAFVTSAVILCLPSAASYLQ